MIEPKQSSGPDRKAAEYVLTIGGLVCINDQLLNLKNTAELPKEHFTLSAIDLAVTPK